MGSSYDAKYPDMFPSNSKSCQPCGCDEGAFHMCEVHWQQKAQELAFYRDEEADVNDYKSHYDKNGLLLADYRYPSNEPAPLSPERRYEAHPWWVEEDESGKGHWTHGTVLSVPYRPLPAENIGIGGAPTRATTLPTGGAERKQFPVASGVLDYFPDALVAVANVSWVGNEQHNPGQPLHWARGKSTDESDTMIRHFLQRGSLDTDGQRHSAKMVWRALAILQKEIEQEKGQ